MLETILGLVRIICTDRNTTQGHVVAAWLSNGTNERIRSDVTSDPRIAEHEVYRVCVLSMM